MKKKIILLPLLVMALTACDLSSLMGNGGNNNGGNEGAQSRAQVDPNDAAIKIASFISVFPEVGNELDMSDYIEFDTGTDYRLEQFTFESQNPDVISVNNYHAICEKEGFASIKVTGPGINTPVEISFYVGSIAGNYTIDSTTYAGVVNLNIVKNNDNYLFNLSVVPNGKKFNKNEVVPYEGSGTLLKNLSPFVPFNFDGEAPSAFKPVTSFLNDLGLKSEEFDNLTQDMYGFMSADEDVGVIFKMHFYGQFISLIAK